MRWILVAAVLAIAALVFLLGREGTGHSESSRSQPQPIAEEHKSTPGPDSSTPPISRLEVRVVSPHDTPVAGALVRLLVEGNEQSQAETDKDGRAWLDASGKGRVAVTRCQPYAPVLSEPIGNRKTITVPLTGGTLAIAGVIVDEFGNPTRNTVAAAIAKPPSWMGKWHWVGRSVPRPDGQFRIEGLPAGEYRLIFRQKVRQDAPVVEAGNESVRIVLNPVCWVTLQLFDRATGKAIDANRRVWKDGVSTGTASGPQSDERPIRLNIEPGTTMRFHATADGYHPTQPVTIEIGTGERERTLRFDLDPDPGALAYLTVQVRREDGSIVKKLMIMRMEADGSGLGTNYNSDDGRYKFTLPAGKSRIRFGPLLRQRKDAPYVVERCEWMLERGERRTENVVLRRGGWLRRTTQDLSVVPSHPKEDKFIMFGIDDYRMLLAPGRYVVTAPGPKGTSLRGEVTVEAGRVHDVELR